MIHDFHNTHKYLYTTADDRTPTPAHYSTLGLLVALNETKQSEAARNLARANVLLHLDTLIAELDRTIARRFPFIQILE